MASANNYAYSNSGATTPPNAFVNNLLQTSAANIPFPSTGAITNSLLPSSVVDDANAANQLQFPHPGPHDYPWAAPPPAPAPAQPPQAQLQHPHVHQLQHPHAHAHQHQHAQSHPHGHHGQTHAHGQQTAQAGEANLMQNKSPRMYHRNHQQLSNTRDHVQYSSPLPTTTPGVVSSQSLTHHHVHQPNSVGIGGVTLHTGNTYGFNTLPLTSGAGGVGGHNADSGAGALVPIAFDETTLPATARGGVSVPLGMGAPLASPLAHPHAHAHAPGRYSDVLVPIPVSASAPIPAPATAPIASSAIGVGAGAAPASVLKKPPRARARRRKSTQPPGTPCVPVHLRNPKKGRDRVFRKCQVCNADNHIRRSNCDECKQPLPAGKRRRDGSMHYEKLKRQKNAAAAAATAAGVGTAAAGTVPAPAHSPSASANKSTSSTPPPLPMSTPTSTSTPTSASLQAPPPIPAPLTQHSTIQSLPIPAHAHVHAQAQQHAHAQVHTHAPVNAISHLDKGAPTAAAAVGTPAASTPSSAPTQAPTPAQSTARAPLQVPISNALPLIPLASIPNALPPSALGVDVVNQSMNAEVNTVNEVNEHQVTEGSAVPQHPHAHTLDVNAGQHPHLGVSAVRNEPQTNRFDEHIDEHNQHNNPNN